MDVSQRPIRTMLFVPGNRPSWLDKGVASNPDAIVLDLEDSVPEREKAQARKLVSDAVAGYKGGRPLLYVRTNHGKHLPNWEDLECVVQPGLTGLFVPKAETPTDVELWSRMVSELEERAGIPIGTVRFVVALETALAAHHAFEIADHARVQTIVSSAAKNADVARALGFRWTAGGLETLYFRSKAVIACRAAGKLFPIGGLWQDVHDLEGLRTFSQFNRQLGFTGEIVLHPSNVPVVNEVYSMSAEERAYFQGLIETFETAEREGKAAAIYRGEHIDVAHVETARQLLLLDGDLRK